MNKRGFTLIELLAVILILGIIALIAIPTVNKVIKQAREGAAISSVTGYIKGVENYTLAGTLSNNVLTNGTYQVSYLKTLDIDVKGTMPTSGWITVQDNEVVEAKVCISKNLIEYDGKDTKVKGTCTDEKMVYTESILHGTDPVINDKLVPVLIADNGEVKKADVKSNWYNYINKRWANAVILTGTDTYAVGTTIPETSIQSYFVWIPRYKYRLFDLGNYNSNDGITHTSVDTITNKAQTIEIVFESKDTTPTIGTKVGDYLTHPSFTTFNSNGMWVGKFETGYDGATTTATAEITSTDSSKIIVKPNVFSWRNNTVYNMFMSSYNYNRSLDSHMMKNTEWGAVAYLSNSEYGINKEVRINNNSARITGYSKTSEPTCGWTGTNEECNRYEGTNLNQDGTYTKMYNTSIGYLASTAGNITGIYDMSGGSHEYMSSYMSGQLGSSGFTTTTIANYNSKYFDTYNSLSSIVSYQYRILGDATGEMGPFTIFKSTGSSGDKTANVNSWYADVSNFVDSSGPWFFRGGSYDDGVLAGQFNFCRYTGGMCTYGGFRLVLTP